MKVQKFRGKTSLEALAKVKEQLGEDAVILSTRRVKEGNRLLYEITAAVDLDPPVSEPRPKESSGFSVVLKEIEEIKELLRGLNAQLKPRSPLFQQLLEQGIPATVLRLFGNNGDLDKEKFLDQLSRRVSRRIGPRELPRLMFFVGPAGVGKTTSLVKLAARLSYAGKEVAIISLDSVRVGAKEQISRFARFLEFPLGFARDEEVEDLVAKYGSCDHVLVDTPALGPSFPVARLAAILKPLEGVGVNLVMRAGEAPLLAQALWERLRALPLSSLILTHSEGLLYGGPLFWIFTPGLPPVSFLSTGDRVPEDFERATAKRLLSLLLRNLDLEGTHV
ncbi:MAG: hypothetical protein GXO17_01455 [Thermodesulfobacteria bacterium]|nr:hypothetical protein [Thermodesulfobacteriota bacterium]